MASTAQAVGQTRSNRFNTGGDLLLNDLTNQAKYKASGSSVSMAVGGNAPGQAPGPRRRVERGGHGL